jgi:hypothetical protein
MQSLSIHSRRRGIRSCIYCFQAGYHPGPCGIPTCRYYIVIDPFTKKPVQTACKLHDRRLQRAFLLFFKPEN